MGEQEDQKQAKTIGDFVSLVALLIIRRPYIAMFLVSGVTGFTFWNMGAGVQGLSHARNWGKRIDTLEYNVHELKLGQDSAKDLETKILNYVKRTKGGAAAIRSASKAKPKHAKADTLNTGAIAKTQE